MNEKTLKYRTLVTMLTWNRIEKLKGNLRAFHKINGKAPIFIFDNGSTDGTRKFLKKKSNYITYRSETNLGPFVGTATMWQFASEYARQNGYKYLLNLEDDFPPIRPVPFRLIEKYLDRHSKVGFVRLNRKKRYLIKNISTRKRLVFDKWKMLSDDWRLRTNNHHFTGNPIVFRAKIAPFMKNATSEYKMMDIYAELYQKSAEIRPVCFRTIEKKVRSKRKRITARRKREKEKLARIQKQEKTKSE